MRNPNLLALAFSLASLLAPPSTAVTRQDLASVRPDYVAAVRDKISAEALDGLDLDAAKAAIDRVAAVDDPEALKILTDDAAAIDKRLLEYGIKLETSKLAIEQNTRKLKSLIGADRAKVEQVIKDAEKDVEAAKKLLPVLRDVNSAMTGGILASIDAVAKAAPDKVWEALVSGLRSDMEQIVKVEEQVRLADAQVKTLGEKLAPAKENEKPEIEKSGAELVARATAGRERLETLETLRARRVEILGESFPRLEKGRQSKELSAIRGNLKDDVAPELRTFHVELIGLLPVPDAYTAPLTAMKKAADEYQKTEKELEPLREAYARAAKAYNTAAVGAGPNGKISVSVHNAMVESQQKVQAASAKSSAATRVVAAASRGLSHALANMDDKARAKASAELLALAKSASDRIVRTASVAAFKAVKDEAVATELRALAAKDPEINTRLAALETLAAMGDEAAVDLCCDSLLKDADWRVRAAAMRFLVDVPRKKAIPVLIKSLAVETGRLVEDAEQALADLTGSHYNGDSALWEAWWAKNEATFEPKPKAKQPKGDDLASADGAESPPGGTPGAPRGEGAEDWRKAGAHVSFYGITTRSSRILFVLDRSGSMLEPISDSQTGKDGGKNKFDAAKLELVAAINGLKDGDSFNLVHYSSDVERWHKQMAKSTLDVRKKATGFVEKELIAIGGTNIYDALREAFRLAGIGSVDKAYQSNVDTIFFLTDGQPTQGEVLDPEEILRRVKEWNKLARVVVHSVGVGKDHDGAFLRRLAEDNGGMYVSR